MRRVRLVAIFSWLLACGGVPPGPDSGATTVTEARCESVCNLRAADSDCLPPGDCAMACSFLLPRFGVVCASELTASYTCIEALSDVCASGGTSSCDSPQGDAVSACIIRNSPDTGP